MTTLHLAVDRASATPLQNQILEGLRRAILEGRLHPGQRVPSTRVLAVELGVSRLPVLSAYEQLLHEGYLEGKVGSGTFVSRALPEDFLRSHGTNASVARRNTSRSTGLRPPRARDEGGLGPFRLSQPALDRFPHATWARMVARQVHRQTLAAMAYGDPAGLGELRVAIAAHLRAARAVQCDAAQVLIVSGSNAALRIAGEVLLGPRDRVAVEDPGYSSAREALGAGGAEVLPIPVDREGISVAALQRYRRPIHAVYVTPSHQYPLGMSMTAGRRMALLEWATQQGAWVLEDDYDSEFRYVSRPLMSLQGMNAQGRVVYLGTFSKVLFPAVRVGYVVVPPELWDRFIKAREAFDLFSPTLYQLTLAEFLRDGHFARHLRRMRGVYLSRREALLAGLALHCGDRLTVHGADAGLHVAAFLAPGLNDVAVVRAMATRGLTATPLSSCYAGSKGRNGLLLGFGGSTEPQLHEATRVLGEVLGLG